MTDNVEDEKVECWFCNNPAGPTRIWLRWLFGKRIPICEECRMQTETFVHLLGESLKRRTRG